MSETLSLLPSPRQQFLDNNGRPIAGGSVAIYLQDTTTFGITYADPLGVATNPNPLQLDAAGSAVIWGSGYYTIVVQDIDGNTIIDGATLAFAGSASVVGSTVGTIVPATAVIDGNAISLTRSTGTQPVTEALGTFLVFICPITINNATFTLAVPEDTLAAAPLQDVGGNAISSLNVNQFCIVGWNEQTSGWALLYNPAAPSTYYPFSASSTWTCPPGVKSVLATGSGGGGAGGSTDSSNSAGGGGGGGAQCEENTLLTVVPGVIYQVSIGVGGTPTGTAAGAAGTATTFISSTFQTLSSLAGGLGGAGGVTTGDLIGGAAGGTGGAIGEDGYRISYGNGIQFGISGAGGGCMLGSGGFGRTAGLYARNGGDGQGYGAGGGGGAGGGLNSGQTNSGGKGASGFFSLQIP